MVHRTWSLAGQVNTLDFHRVPIIFQPVPQLINLIDRRVTQFVERQTFGDSFFIFHYSTSFMF